MAATTKTAYAAIVALLAACGGGSGGGGASDSCPAGSVVSIQPPSLRVTAGSGPTEFGGSASNCTADAHWDLTGPGSLDKTTGVPVHFTPPASVDAVATATLTISMGGLSTSATITIDPSIVILHGRVLLASGGRAANSTVRVGTSTTTADASGSFTLPGVEPPYDIYVTAQNSVLTSVYPGLRRPDPTLMLFDSNYFPTTWLPGLGTSGGYATGTLSSGAGFPEPAGHVASVAFYSSETTANCTGNASTGAFTLQAAWSGASATTGSLLALQWSVDAIGMPVSYDGYAARLGVTIAAGSTLSGQDFALSPVTTSTLTGSMSDGNTAGLAARVVLPGGAWIQFLPPPGANTYFVEHETPFSLPTPAISGAAIDLVARRDFVDWAYEEVHLHGLAASASTATVLFGGLPQTSTPPSGAAGVGAGTFFGWYTMRDSPVYVVSFRPGIGAPSGSPLYDVFIAGSNNFVIPDGIPLPKNAPYTWRVRGSSAFTTVEDAAGPGSFLAAKPFYRVAQGTSSTFTTAP